MSNPFCNTLDISGRALMNDPNVDIVYKNLPPGTGAAYSFADTEKGLRARIELPRIDVLSMTEEQKRKWSALMVHEIGHHHDSSKEALDEAYDRSHLAGNLWNCLEDARSEMNKTHQSPGAYEDLIQYRIEKFHEMFNDENKSNAGIFLYTNVGSFSYFLYSFLNLS